LQKAIEKKQKRLLELQSEEDTPATVEMQELRQYLNVLLEKEELRWKQRAKEEWLRYGDRNTKYYHACANARRKRNFVEAIKDEDGLLRDKPNAVGEAFVDFFHKIILRRTEMRP
jgi:hypothetical protein